MDSILTTLALVQFSAPVYQLCTVLTNSYFRSRIGFRTIGGGTASVLNVSNQFYHFLIYFSLTCPKLSRDRIENSIKRWWSCWHALVGGSSVIGGSKQSRKNIVSWHRSLTRYIDIQEHSKNLNLTQITSKVSVLYSVLSQKECQPSEWAQKIYKWSYIKPNQELPPQFFKLTALRILSLSDNDLTQLSSDITHLR